MAIRHGSMHAWTWMALLAVSSACAGRDAGETTDAAADSGSPGRSADAVASTGGAPAAADAVLVVTITRDDGTEAAPATVPPGSGVASLTQVGDFTSVTAMFGDASPIGTATLKTRAASTGTLRLDDQGETADALRLLFLFRGEPAGGALEGQYESIEGEVSVTALEPGRIAGTFDGTFERQHDDRRHRVRGSFDFRRER